MTLALKRLLIFALVMMSAIFVFKLLGYQIDVETFILVLVIELLTGIVASFVLGET